MDRSMWRRLRGLAGGVLLGALTILVVALAAQTLPLELAFLFTGDLLLYLEAATSVWLASRIANFRGAMHWLKAVISRRPMPRQRSRKKPPRRVLPPKKPEDPEPAWQLCLAA